MSGRTWNRLEPIVDGASVAGGLAAVLADPLWLLGRQWQIGELTAEDAGTPVVAIVTTHAHTIDRLRIGDQIRPLEPGVPLEAMVEPEPPATPDLRTRLRAGLRLLERLAAIPGAAAVLARHFAPAPPSDRRAAALVRALGKRAIDAESVLATITADRSRLVATLGGDRARVEGILDGWVSWYQQRTGRDAPSAWDPEHGVYRFELLVTAGNQDLVLTTDTYRGGRLDWHDLRAAPPTAATEQEPATEPRREALLPAPIDLPGGPARRFFEIESDAIDITRLNGDVATSLVAEFALVFGGDWFVVPISTPVGSLCRIGRIDVSDTFGTTTSFTDRLRSPGWRLYELSGDPVAEPYLVVLPTVSQPLDGPVLEQLSIGRDEAANLAWAVEETVPDALGQPVTAHPLPAPTPAPATATSWRYRPFVPPPPGWYPLIRRGRDLVGAPTRAEAESPRGHLLAEWPSTRLPNTTLPRDGLRITRRWQLAVTASGDRRLWIARETSAGRGGLSSGAIADALVPAGDE